MYVSTGFFFGRKESRVASRPVDGPVLWGGSTQIWWSWVRVYLMLFGKEEIFFDERLGLMWNESITAIISKERWDKCQV